MPEGGDPDLLAELAGLETRDEARRVHTSVVRVMSDLRDQPTSTADAYLRLHLLHRLAEPNTINLDGIRSRLPVVAWTSAGPARLRTLRRPASGYAPTTATPPPSQVWMISHQW